MSRNVSRVREWLEEMLPDALAGGQEGYCVCTLQVATCFLRQLQQPPTAGPG